MRSVQPALWFGRYRCVADATGGAIQQQNSSSREYVVDLTLTDEGKTKFAEATQNNVGKQIAIIYDNGVLSAQE